MQHRIAANKRMSVKLTLTALWAFVALFVSLIAPRVALAAETITISNQSDLENVIERNDKSDAILQLANDVTIETSFNYKIPQSDNLTLDLNGHTLTLDGAARIACNNNLTFNIIDSSGKQSEIKLTNRTNQAIEFNKGTLNITGISSTDNNSAQPFMTTGGDAGTLTIDTCSFSNNKTSANGAIVHGTAGNVIVKNSTFKGNKGTNGGALCIENGSLTTTGCTFEGNEANEGGAIYANNSTVTMSSGSISQNNASSNGGGIYAWNSKLDLTGGEISNNTATTDGGGVYLSYVNGGETTSAYGLTVSGGKITDNTATNGFGGGVYLTGNSGTHQAVISSGSVSGNTAGTNGGGIYVTSEQDNQVTLEVSGGTIANNEAANNGGGIAAAGKTTVTVESGTISGNHASNSVWAQGGGGIVAEGDSILLVKGGTIERNVSEGSGGGILFRGGTFKMTGGTVDSNVAKLHEGGGIAIISGMANIAGGRITNNASGYDEDGSPIEDYQDWGGGGIFVSDQGGVLVMRKDTLVTNNGAGGFGGGVAACSTGRTYLLDTIAVYGNTADGEHLSGAGSVKHDDHQYAYDNETFMANGYQDYYSALFSYVTNTMPGGYENWTGSSDGVHVEASGKDVIISSSTIGLTAQGTSSLAESQFAVVVTGNKAYTHGGGILNNGTVIYGEADEMVIGRALAIEATKMLYDTDGEGDKRAELWAEVDDERVSQCAFVISTAKPGEGTDDDVVSEGKIVVNYVDGDEGKGVSSADILFDRRLTFDESNCTDENVQSDGSWKFTYYVYETDDLPGWMVSDGAVYQLDVVVNKNLNSQPVCGY